MMEKRTRTQIESGVIAAVHQAGKVWRCVAGRISQGRLTIVDHREFPAAGGQDSRIRNWMDQHQVAHAVVVLPSASVICRTCQLPNATPQELEPALRLQAESHLLGQTPAHRQAMAVLHAAAGETTRCGIVLAWPQSAPAPKIELGGPESRTITYAPDIAAIAALLNGQRTTEPVLSVDRRDGSISLAMTHAGGVTFRTTREEATDTSAWAGNVGRVVAETALSVNHTGTFVDSLVQAVKKQLVELQRDQAALFVPDELISALNARVEGPARDAKFWSEFGLSAGTLLAMANHLGALTQMQDAPPIEEPTAFSRIADALSDRRRATMIVAVCVLAILLSPIAISGMRLAVLSWKLPDSATQREAKLADEQLTMYSSLTDQAWPMTKLLGDLANCVPTSIEVELIDIQQGQEIRLGGRAKKDSEAGLTAPEVVALMKEKLSSTMMFADFRHNVSDGDSLGNYQFDMSFRVTHPYRNVRYDEEDDFAVTSQYDRLFHDYPGYEGPLSGDSGSSGSSATLVSDTSTSPSEESGSGDPTMVADVGNGSESDEDNGGYRPIRRGPRTPSDPRLGGEAARIGEDSDVGFAPSQDIPNPKTPEQIRAMNFDEARAHRLDLAKAMRRGAIDDDTRQRLREEWDIVGERLRELTPNQ